MVCVRQGTHAAVNTFTDTFTGVAASASVSAVFTLCFWA